MEEKILYFDGVSTRPQEVRVLVFHDELHLHKDDDPGFYRSFSSSNLTINRVDHHCFVYLDPSGLRYLQMPTHAAILSSIKNEIQDNRRSWFQRLMAQRLVLLVAILIGLMVGFYFLIVTIVPVVGMRTISPGREIAIGKRLKEAMLSEEQLMGHKVLEAGTQTLQGFADKLQLSSTYPIQLTLVKSSMINAYALPGGSIVVYTGIIDKMQSPDELAALLAHEATHINERHSLKSMLRSAANGLIISVLFGDISGVSGVLVSNAEALHGLQYSRRLETEADQKGMDLLLANGVNLDGMRMLMLRLQQAEELPSELSFISTHPLTKNRMKAAEAYAASHPQQLQRRADLNALFIHLKKGL